MSFLNCGTCAKSKISDSLDHRQSQQESLDTSFDIIDEKVAVRTVEMAADSTNYTVYNVTNMEPVPEHYQLLIVIGQGCFDTASVHLAKHIPSDTLVAVKVIKMDDCKVDFHLVQYGLQMHKTLRHPHLLPCLNSSFVTNDEIWTVFPLMAYGSCRDLLHAHFAEGLPELAIAYILHDLLQALEYLHSSGIIHRAVKASHVLVSASGHVVLSGFHHVLPIISDGKRRRAVHDFPNHYHSCLNWASPELLEQNLAGYDTKSDIYSLGILACELANGVVPFADMPATQMLLEKMEGTTPRLLDSNTVPELQMIQEEEEEQPAMGETSTGDSALGASNIPYQRTFSPHFHNLVELCLQTDPNLRPTAAALLQHSYFRQIRRKSGSQPLTELLKPVSPLNTLDISSLGEKDSELDGVMKNMEEISMEDWSF